jgi:protein SCO1/2
MDASRRGLLTAVGGGAFALALAGAGVYIYLTPPAASGLAVGGPFTLASGDQPEVTDRRFRGKYMLIYFGYTFCPDVCPTTLSAVADALDQLGPLADKLQPLFITVDPKRDTPAVVKQYAAAFSPRLIGLSGTEAQIAAVAKEYHVYYEIHAPKPGRADYAVDHSSALYLMGPDGGFVALIPADGSSEQIAARLKPYLAG